MATVGTRRMIPWMVRSGGLFKSTRNMAEWHVEYWKHWRMTRHPFAVRKHDDGFYPHGAIGEVLGRCESLLSRPGATGLLVGALGVGKTRILRRLWTQCSSNHRSIAPIRDPFEVSEHSASEAVAPDEKQHYDEKRHYIDLEHATAIEFLERVARAMQLDPKRNAFATQQAAGQPSTVGAPVVRRGPAARLGRASIDDLGLGPTHHPHWMVAIEERLGQWIASGQRVVFLFDHVGKAHPDAAQALALLLSRWSGIRSILAAEKDSVAKLPKRLLEGCDRRIEIGNWSLEDWAGALEWVLRDCGGSPEIFAPEAVHRIHEIAHGNALLMVQMADFALSETARNQCSVVDVQRVDQVHRDAFGPFTEACEEFQFA